MINYLKDCWKTTLIGQLPDIINSNNESIRNEFNWIYDSSLNRLTKSVYAPTGSVKSHFGEFVNLACEYITIKNIDSLKNSIQTCVEEIVTDVLDPSIDGVQIANLKTCSDEFVFTYNGNNYTASEIGEILEWFKEFKSQQHNQNNEN